MTETAQAVLIAIGAVCGALLAILGVLGALWTVIRPWLREQIAVPVQVTRDHVANDHSSNLREDIDDITRGLAAARMEIGAARVEIAAARSEVADARSEVADVKAKGEHTDEKVSRIGGQLDTHLSSAATTDAAVHARLTALELRQEKR